MAPANLEEVLEAGPVAALPEEAHKMETDDKRDSVEPEPDPDCYWNADLDVSQVTDQPRRLLDTISFGDCPDKEVVFCHPIIPRICSSDDPAIRYKERAHDPDLPALTSDENRVSHRRMTKIEYPDSCHQL